MLMAKEVAVACLKEVAVVVSGKPRKSSCTIAIFGPII
jgi:hypothetical protein